MKKLLKALGVVVVVCALWFATPAAAEECTNGNSGLSISPVNQPIMLEAGASNEYEFTVKNVSNDAAAFRIYASPYTVADENYTMNFSNNEDKYTQLTRWIKIVDANGVLKDEAIFNVASCAETVVKYRVNVPDSIPNGSQHAIIFAEGINNSDAGGIKAVSRVGLVIYGRGVGETITSFETTDFVISKEPDDTLTDASGKKITKPVIHASALVKNTGNTDVTANITFTAKNVFGTTLYQNAHPENVFAESIRKVTDLWENTPLFGLFKISFTININGDVQSHEGLVLIMPAFIIIIIIVLIVIVTVWIILLIKKNRDRKNRRME